MNEHLDEEEKLSAHQRHLTASLQEQQHATSLKNHFSQPKNPMEASNAVEMASNSHKDTEVYCSTCDCGIFIEEWDSHCLQHQLEAEEIVAQAEEREIQENWFSQNEGVGVPEHSGGDAHFCRILDRVEAQQPALKEEIRDLVLHQSRSDFHVVEEGIAVLLRRCLEAESHGFVQAALSGHVDHYFSKHLDDLGWGCGWRNIQMLCSHLLQRDEESKKALFGGVGFVPEIPSLQHWLELSWKQGFDKVGAEQLAHKVFATHKWIGTTECAALLRSFGFRARIVDFKSSPGEAHGPQEVKFQDKCFTGSSSEQALQNQCTGPPVFRDSENNSRPCSRTASMHKEQHLSCRSSREGTENLQLRNEGEKDVGVNLKGKRKEEGGGQGHMSGYQHMSCGSGPFTENGDRTRKRVKESEVNQLQYKASYGNVDEEVEAFHRQNISDSSPDKNFLGKRKYVEKCSSTSERSCSKDVGGMGAGGGGADNASKLTTQHMKLVQWVWEYFTEGRRRKSGFMNAFDALGQQVYMSNKPPLYFQHQGHSRTIVGIELRRKQGATTEEVFLLVLDPSQRTVELEKVLRQCKGWQRMVKRGLHTLRKAEYQLCYIDPGLAEGEELEQLKVLESVLHSY